MKHKIEIAPNLAIYIDGERVIGSKPHGLFLTTEMIVSDEDLKRLADRCLEVIADRKTENSSEKPNNFEDFFREPTAEERKAVADYIDSISVPTGVNAFDFMDEPTISKMEQVEDEPQTCDTCKYGEDKHRYAHICNECGVGINNYEPRTEGNE